MRRQVQIAAAILLAVLFYMPGVSQQVYIPSYDPIYQRIENLQAHGYLSDLSQTEKPYLISDVTGALEKDMPLDDSTYNKLAADILAYLRPATKISADELTGRMEGSLTLRGLSRERRQGYFYWRDQFTRRNFKGELGSVYDVRVYASKAHWGFDTQLIFDSDGTGYQWYYGTRHNARIVGQFDNAYFNFVTDHFNFMIGRERLVWGPSPRGSLLLDDSSPPLDMISYGVTLRPFHLSAFLSRLDDYYDPDTGLWNRRYLSGHRLRVNPGKGWEIALSEIYLYGGPDRLPELYYNIPIILYYWEQQNRNLDDNAFWAADISWQRAKLGRFYAQFIADDIQRQHRGPQKFAWQFGAHLAPSALPGWSGLFELNIVDTYVYGQRKRVNAYLNWGWPLGRLDSDQREYFAGIYRDFGGRLRLGAEFIGRDKGEYDAADFQPNMAPFGIPFPSGVVEKTRIYSLAFSWYSQHRLDLEFCPGFETIKNYSHEPGWSFNQFYARLQMTAGINLGLPLWKESR